MAGHRDGGNVTQNGVLWKFIQDGTRGLLEQAKVQPLTILDLEDLEQLAGFVEAGYDLPKILAGKTQQAFRHRELAIWVRKGLRRRANSRAHRLSSESGTKRWRERLR
jgi:hypothetical protein